MVKSGMKICSLPDCEKSHKANSLCSMHYQRIQKHGDLLERRVSNTGRVKHPLYATYNHMLGRCYRIEHPRYSDWGGRGITICDRWLGVHGFDHFIADMGEKPDNTSLDRINNNGNYEPSNCRWANIHQQNLNQRIRKDNKSGYKNVDWHKVMSKWEARIRIDGKRTRLGFFDSKEEAIKAIERSQV